MTVERGGRVGFVCGRGHCRATGFTEPGKAFVVDAVPSNSSLKAMQVLDTSCRTDSASPSVLSVELLAPVPVVVYRRRAEPPADNRNVGDWPRRHPTLFVSLPAHCHILRLEM